METSKRVIGVFLIVISLAGLVVWEKWGKDEFFYDDVLVLRDSVERGTVITASMLTARKMNIDEDYLTYEEREQIIGRQADAFVHEGVPLFVEYFVDPSLSPDERKDKYALALPQEWIVARPETLSRGDKVFFFYGKTCVTAAYVSLVSKDGAVEVIVSREQAADISGILEEGGRFVLIYQ